MLAMNNNREDFNRMIRDAIECHICFNEDSTLTWSICNQPGMRVIYGHDAAMVILWRTDDGTVRRESKAGHRRIMQRDDALVMDWKAESAGHTITLFSSVFSHWSS